MFDRFLKNDIALALCGDAVWVGRRGDAVITRVPAYVAVQSASAKVIAIGEEARAMTGLEPQNIKVVRLADPASLINATDAWSGFLKAVIKKTQRQTAVFPPRVIFVAEAMPRIVLRQVVLAAGAREALFLESRMAAAIGAGIAVERPEPCAVLVLDRFSTSFAAISLAGVLAGFSMEQGVSRLLEDIALHTLATRNVALDVERLHSGIAKQGLTGTNAIGWESWVAEIGSGRISATSFTDPDMLRLALPFQHLLGWHHRRCFETIPLEKRVAAESVPVLFAGPYARVAGFRDVIAAAFLRQVIVADEPEECLIRGALAVMRDLTFLLSYASAAKPRAGA